MLLTINSVQYMIFATYKLPLKDTSPPTNNRLLKETSFITVRRLFKDTSPPTNNRALKETSL